MAKQKSSFASFGMIPMAATVVGFVIAAAVSIFVVQSSANSGHQTQLGQALAGEIAQQVNIKEALVKSQLQRIAESGGIVAAITGSNTELLEAESNAATMIPYAERLKLIPMGQGKTDQGFPPFNYTALDIVGQVESGEAPEGEAISSQPQLTGDKWVIYAAPVKSRDGTIRGTLFAFLGAQFLAADLTDGNKGQVQVLQNVGTTPKPIVVAGSEGSPTIYTAELRNPNWTLAYSPSPALASSAPTNIVFYLIPAIAMLLLSLIGIFVGANQTGSSLKMNIEKLGKQISRVANDNYEGIAGYTLPGFEEQDARLNLIADMKPAAAPKAEPAKPAAATPQAAPVAEPAEEVVEIEMVDEESFEEVEEIEVDDFEEAVEAANAEPEPEEPATDISGIFRAYDIRGVVGETLSEDIARQIGLAIGSEAEDRGEQTVCVGYDGREYSPALAEALIEGLTTSGRDVINIGAVPTPVLYYATHNLGAPSGVMVTGSHNPPQYNGFKVVLEGKTLVDEEIKALHQRIVDGNFTEGEGDVTTTDISQDYMDAIADDVVVAQPLKVVIDCGNGIAGSIAPELFDSLGCEAVPLYCEVDGSFPNHHPDPTKPENLEDLTLTVQSQGADLGIGLDGDGDRLVAVTADGEIVWPDRLLMLFAKDIVSRNPGSDVVYDVKCTRHLNSVISGFGGRPIISRSGHSFVKQKIAETDAMLGGELSGHICFSERWFGFDDGLYSAARLLEIVGSQEDGLADLLKEFPASINTPEIHIAVPDSEKFDLVEALIAVADFEDATTTTIDGLRVDFSDGWGLVRASNTEPALTLRFEADNEDALGDIKGAFKELLQEVNSDLDFD